MRIRTIKPEWLDDEKMLLASDAAARASVALLLLADDYGNGRANPQLLGARIFPAVESPGEKMCRVLDELTDMDFVLLYEVRGQKYFHIRNWEKHQRVDRPGKPRVPPPNEKVLGTHEKVLGTHATDRDRDPDLDRDRDQGPARNVSVISAWKPDYSALDGELKNTSVYNVFSSTYQKNTNGFALSAPSAKQLDRCSEIVEQLRFAHMSEPNAAKRYVMAEVLGFCALVMAKAISVEKNAFSCFLSGWGSWQYRSKEVTGERRG